MSERLSAAEIERIESASARAAHLGRPEFEHLLALCSEVRAAWAESEALKEALRDGRERIEQQRDATRLTLDDPSLTTYQQVKTAARAWAFDHSMQLLDDARALVGSPSLVCSVSVTFSRSSEPV